MSVRTAVSLYLLAQNTLLILPLALILILKITPNCGAILDSIAKMSEDMYCPSNCQTFLKSSVFCVLSFYSSVPLPAPNLTIDIPKLFPHTDNGAISSHLPCIFLSLSVLLIVKEYRSEFVTVRGLTPSRQGILWRGFLAVITACADCWWPHWMWQQEGSCCVSERFSACIIKSEDGANSLLRGFGLSLKSQVVTPPEYRSHKARYPLV